MKEHRTDMTITKIEKYNKLNNNFMTEHKTNIRIQKLIRTEHKTDMNITEKLNSTSTAEYKTDMNLD